MGGHAPLSETIEFFPNIMAGDDHEVELEFTTVGADNPVRLSQASSTALISQATRRRPRTPPGLRPLPRPLPLASMSTTPTCLAPPPKCPWD